jgi:hypothetical protein
MEGQETIESRVESHLEGVLNRVVDWLKYEEAKNGALVTLDGVGAGVILQWLSINSNATSATSPWLKGALAALFASLIIALFSFWPILKGQRLHKYAAKRRESQVKHGTLSDPNILFFAHIAGSDWKEYLRAFRAAVGAKPEGGSTLESDYAREIIANAEIAVLKLCLFEVAVVLALLGFITACAAAVVHLLP